MTKYNKAKLWLAPDASFPNSPPIHLPSRHPFSLYCPLNTLNPPSIIFSLKVPISSTLLVLFSPSLYPLMSPSFHWPTHIWLWETTDNVLLNSPLKCPQSLHSSFISLVLLFIHSPVHDYKTKVITGSWYFIFSVLNFFNPSSLIHHLILTLVLRSQSSQFFHSSITRIIIWSFLNFFHTSSFYFPSILTLYLHFLISVSFFTLFPLYWCPYISLPLHPSMTITWPELQLPLSNFVFPSLTSYILHTVFLNFLTFPFVLPVFPCIHPLIRD